MVKPQNIIISENGVNSRLDEIQAAILNWGLKKLKYWNTKREVLARIYINELKDLPIILPPDSNKDSTGVWHLFVIRSKERNKLRDFLQKKGIGTAIHYPKPVFEQTAYKYLGYNGRSLPVTKEIMSEILSLPLYPELSRKEVIEVCKALKSFYGEK